MGPEMLAENRVVGFTDLPALKFKGGYYRSPYEVKGSAYNEFKILRKSKPQDG